MRSTPRRAWPGWPFELSRPRAVLQKHFLLGVRQQLQRPQQQEIGGVTSVYPCQPPSPNESTFYFPNPLNLGMLLRLAKLMLMLGVRAAGEFAHVIHALKVQHFDQANP